MFKTRSVIVLVAMSTSMAAGSVIRWQGAPKAAPSPSFEVASVKLFKDEPPLTAVPKLGWPRDSGIALPLRFISGWPHRR